MTINDVLPLIIAITAMLISLITLIYTIKTFLFKNGQYITGYYSLCNSSACEDPYISKIVLENKKDKAVIIYQIYLQIGYNYFILLDDFEKKPLILASFEAFSKDYDPIDHYVDNLEHIRLTKLLEDKKIKQNIVLSTSEGKYKVKGVKGRWSPINKMFKNHMTIIINPIRIIYKEKSYGSNTQYILDIKNTEDRDEVIPIYPGDYQLKKFINFQLTKECLESKKNLEDFLTHEKSLGHIMCKKFKVIDVKEAYKLDENNHYTEIPEMPYVNWFSYYILGRIATIYEDYKLNQENKKILSRLKKR